MKPIKILFLALVVSPISMAQTKPNVSKKSSTPKILINKISSEALVFQNDPFVEANYQEKLPPRFQGIGTKELFESLDHYRKLKTKNEYETTEQFNKRVADSKNKPFMRNIAIDGQIALGFFEPSLKLNYNADQGTFTIQIEKIQTPENITGRARDSMIVVEIEKQTSAKDVIFQNAFGATRQGKQTNVERLGAILMNTVPISFNIKILSPEAKELRNKGIGVIYSGRLLGPEISIGRSFRDATLESPNTQLEITQSIWFDVNTVLIYTVSSGQILQKITIK